MQIVNNQNNIYLDGNLSGRAGGLPHQAQPGFYDQQYGHHGQSAFMPFHEQFMPAGAFTSRKPQHFQM